MAEIKEILGNLFDSPCKTLVNTVNCVGIMGKGIALEFKYRYPNMFKEYSEKCNKKEIQPGHLWVWKRESPWILCFPTKFHWKYPSKIEHIKLGLENFQKSYKTESIDSIAFPILGASLGGLDQDEVLFVMKNYLQPLPDLSVEIYQWNSLAEDRLFNKLKSVLVDLDENDIKKLLRLSSKIVKLLIKSLQNRQIQSMLDLREVKGLGDKTLVKIYDLAMSQSKEVNQTIITKQKKLDFKS